jgi:hypothetical protein
VGDVEYGLLRRVALEDFADLIRGKKSSDLYALAKKQERRAAVATERALRLKQLGDMCLEYEMKESAKDK